MGWGGVDVGRPEGGNKGGCPQVAEEYLGVIQETQITRNGHMEGPDAFHTVSSIRHCEKVFVPAEYTGSYMR